MTGADSKVARLAAGQHGMVTRSQAHLLGLTPRQVDVRVPSGRYEMRARGVYRVAGAPALWKQDVMAACLSGPSGTVASHLTAAALFGLDRRRTAVLHVTIPPGRSPRMAGVCVHRSLLAGADRQRVAEIPCTRPARTLVDCAGVAAPAHLAELVHQACT